VGVPEQRPSSSLNDPINSFRHRYSPGHLQILMTIRPNVTAFSSYTDNCAGYFACNAGRICPIVAEESWHDGESHSQSDLCDIFKCGNMLQTKLDNGKY
jgi:hypothetical protein